MIIGQVLDKFLPITEPWIYSQIKGLEKLGIKSKVFCHKIINSDSYHHHPLFSYKNLPSWKINAYRAKSLLKKMDAATLYWNEVLKKERIDLIHSHFGWAAKKGIDLAIKNNLPHIVTFYGADIVRDPYGIRPEQKAYQKKLGLIFEKSTVILCTSNFLKHKLLKLGAPKEKTKVWRLGVDQNLFKKRNKESSNQEFKIISVGRFIDWKGQKYLIQALPKVIKEYPHIKVIFIGEGPTFNDCKKLAKKLDVDQYVVFEGVKDHREVAELMSASDLLVQTSTQREVLGMTLAEAGACGLSLLASNAGGMPEIVIHGKTGLLFEQGNINQIAKSIIQLIKDKALREKLGKNARLHVRKHFHLDTQLVKLNIIYTESKSGYK